MLELQIEGVEKLLDDVGWRLLRELQNDARLSFAELGRRVGLSAPAVMERVRKMEDTGIISGYHAAVNVEKIGLPVQAILRISNPGEACPVIAEVARDMPEVLECHRVTGHDCFVMSVAVASIVALEALIDHFSPYGQTITAIVLSSPVKRRTIERPAESAL